MAKIFILRPFEGSDQASIFLSGSLNAEADAFQVTNLHIDRVTVAFAPPPIPVANLVPINADFKFASTATVSLQHEVALASDFLGLLKAGAKLSVSISNPPSGPSSPFLTVVVSGGLAIDLGPLAGLDELTYQLTLDEPPLDLVAIPKLDLNFSRFKLPTLRLPTWHLPDFPNTPFKLEASRIEPVSLPFDVAWKRLTVRVDPGPKSILVFEQLEITTFHLESLKVKGDLTLIFQGGLLSTGSTFKASGSSDIGLSNLSVRDQSFTLDLRENDISRWFASLLPNLDLPKVGAKVTLQVSLGTDNTIRQIRLDWKEEPASAGARVFRLPGLAIEHSNQPLYTLFLGADAAKISKLALCWSVDANQSFAVQSSFAWQRDAERELHNDTGAPSPFKFSATALKKMTLVALQADITTAALPRFFQQIDPPLAALSSDSEPVAIAPQPLDVPSSWKIDFALATPFTFPFLRKTANDPEPNSLPQFLEIKPDGNATVADHAIRVPFSVVVNIATLRLETFAALDFNWESFAFKVNHAKGIPLTAKEERLSSEGLLGLGWIFKGKKIAEEAFHYFTLVTDDFNYQLQQAPGAVFQIEYKKLSADPLTFEVSDFVLTPKGLNLRAAATDKPVRLNGIDTQFRFGGSAFEIRENHINDFTLTGTGALPPALVGEASVDVALQFRQEGTENVLVLVAGHADLKSKKPLRCAQTRFEFALSSIGLRFVPEGSRYHLYFVLTGSATFSDDSHVALGLLSKIKIELVECPLTGDASVIGRHVRFLVELPSPKSFNFLGCFEMELRGIGFLPQVEAFDNASAMQLSGQVKFVQGLGDAPDSRIDYHSLLIGVPAPGDLVPRLKLSELPVNINVGEAFRLNGSVEFVDKTNEQGFTGDGRLQIQGLPTIAAAFAFLRVRRDEVSPWLRAWFIFIELPEVSFMIPVIQIYIREIGLGFGYRYTLVSLKTADAAKDIRTLLKELKVLSRTQGDLSKRDRWAVDLEEPGEDPRWTIAFRAMISQTSASTLLTYNKSGEQSLSCLFLLDAVAALRSDLTFFMAVRGWLWANYDEFRNNQELRDHPLVSGFVLLSPRQKRFLAHLASNPDGELGNHPPLPGFVKEAIKSCQFSATLLIEPGLLHCELGWPNGLRWMIRLGPLVVEARGGFLFRVTSDEIVIGNSFMARGSLDISAELDLGFIGVRASAHADVAYGARYIGVLSLRDPAGKSAFYAAVGLEIHVSLSIEAWIHIDLFLTTIDLSFGFSIAIGFTAGLELAIDELQPGLRGSATISLSVCGHDLQLNVKLAANEERVEAALKRTGKFLEMGLEAGDVEGIPGVEASPLSRLPGEPFRRELALDAEPRIGPPFIAPDYHFFVVRRTSWDGFTYMVLIPKGAEDGNRAGFLPVPFADITQQVTDLEVTFLDAAGLGLAQFVNGGFAVMTGANGNLKGVSKVKWGDEYRKVTAAYPQENAQGNPVPKVVTFAQYLGSAFIVRKENNTMVPLRDPDPLPLSSSQDRIYDERVYNPSDTAFEAAVRGAVQQFEGSPFFKKDSANVAYDKLLERAFETTTTIYAKKGISRQSTARSGAPSDEALNRQAHQTRGMIIHDFIADVRAYSEEQDAEKRKDLVKTSIPFAMGLVFRFRGIDLPDDFEGQIRQRISRTESTLSDPRKVTIYNLAAANFETNPPTFRRIRHYTDATTIAIAWDLVWENPPAGSNGASSQGDPEHHLMHYRILRRAIGSGESDVLTTVKPAAVLHREPGESGDDVLKRLQPRFKVVDHFKDETLEDQALLPIEGKSYIYTIAPVDCSGCFGRPITLRATRFSSEPPLVPATGELFVDYELKPDDFKPREIDSAGSPQSVEPAQVRARWSEPPPAARKPHVAVFKYLLIFRKEPTIPIGSYGLDSSTQGTRGKLLPTSNARKLPTDAEIAFEIKDLEQSREDGSLIHEAKVDLVTLTQLGVLPAAEGTPKVRRWRAESWRVFLQAVSVGGVPSALAPVQIKLNVRMGASVTAVEQRAPAALEWLPYPLQEEFLPAEDSNARTGTVHVPVPKKVLFPASEAIQQIAFRPHPARIRCIEFRWNQGSSTEPRKLLDLNAGYRFYELDIDEHNAETLNIDEHDKEGRKRLTDALRFIRDIEILPTDELALAPRETTNPSQWEAWYPSRLFRLAKAESAKSAPNGSKSPSAPWFSWRDSVLLWPQWPGLTEPEGTRARDGELHVFLREFIAALRENPADIAGMQRFGVDLQVCPPIQPSNFAGFMAATAPKSDPYGWGVLQRLGLSVAFSLRTNNGEIVTGDDLIAALNAVREKYKDQHLVFEFPPISLSGEASAALAPDAEKVVAALELLNKKKHFYGRTSLVLALKNSLGTELLTKRIDNTHTLGSFIFENIEKSTPFGDFYQHLFFELLVKPGRSVSLVGGPLEHKDLLATVQVSLRPLTVQTLKYHKVDLEGPPDRDVEVTFGNAGPLSVIDLAGQEGPGKTSKLEQVDLKKLTVRLSSEGKGVCLVRSETTPTISVVVVGNPAVSVTATSPPEEISPKDQNLAEFNISTEMLAERFAKPGTSPDAAQWERTKYYLEALNSTDPNVDAKSKITLSADDKNKIKEDLPQFLAWSQRFFDHGVEPLTAKLDPALGGSADGPWLVTAYPRSSSPTPAAPDDFGRLTFHHLLPDDWAHNYRYVIRVQRRYDLLWNSFRRSRVLFPDGVTELEPLLFDPAAGGLDVVLDRAHPITMPLVLRSGRLDLRREEGEASKPGTVWEVIVARHPEQTLMERNQSLVRRLSFRHVSFTLLRARGYADWPDQLFRIASPSTPIVIMPVQDTSAEIPDAYPDKPEHVDLTASALEEDAICAFDFPRRIDAFSQGALVLQWKALPFFYNHKLLLIAQSASTVSEVNEVIQTDFEYCAPVPEGTFDSQEFTRDGITRELRIPLRRFWDSLPEDAQKQWPGDAPERVDSPETRRKVASLPDREVIYEIVERIDGNIEVQFEFFVELSDDIPKYSARQLGKRFQVANPNSVRVLAPELPQGNFVLIAKATHPAGRTLASEDFISARPNASDQFGERIEFAETAECALVWDGEVSSDEKAGLLDLRGDQAFVDAVKKLVNDAAAAALTTKVIPAGPEQMPDRLAQSKKLEFALSEPGGERFTALNWTGPLELEEEQILRAWAQIPELVAAVETLIVGIDTNVVTVSAGATSFPSLSGDIAAQLQFIKDPDTANVTCTWRGRISQKKIDTLLAIVAPQAIKDAISEIINKLKSAKFTIPLDLPRRPAMSELNDVLSQKLLIGRLLARTKRFLSATEARELQGLFPLSPDKSAIERIYRDGVRKSLNGSKFHVRARRGSAPCSDLMPLEIAAL